MLYKIVKSFAKAALLLTLLPPLLSGSVKKKDKRPNIVFILIDDMGYSDIGCYGSTYYETPNIDKLAKQGIKFTNAYAASTLCSPTRASILTGKYPGRLHITHAIPIEGYSRLPNTPLMDADYTKNLPLEEVTFAEVLKNDGYKTAAIGKWHVCWDKQYFPQSQGFDQNMGGGGMGSTMDYFYPYAGKWKMNPQSPVVEWQVFPDGKKGEYLTDRLTDETLRFIEQNKEGPFLAYLQHYGVHTPIQAKDSLIKKYLRKPVDSLKRHTHPKYAAMIESIDESVGRIMRKLDELGLSDNTIVVFTSDNGGHGRITSNWPFRGNKGNFYEGGIRVPLIIKWPGHIKSGRSTDAQFISTDFYPTLLGLAHLYAGEEYIDGINQAPLLTQDKSISRNRLLFWHFPNYTGTGHPNASGPCSVIRDGKWKLLEYFEDGSLELYDLQKDIKEKNNLAKLYPQVTADLHKKLAEWRKEAKVQMPRLNPAYQANR